VYNEQEGIDYLARIVDEDVVSGEYLYSLEVIDENVIHSGILEEEGLIEKSTSEKIEDLAEDKSLRGVWFAVLGMFFLTTCFGIVFYFKKHNQKTTLSRLLEAKISGDTVDVSDEKTKRYQKYIDEIHSYMDQHKDVSDSELRSRLEKIGWNKDILDVVFKK
jgi:hypothetical protein